MFLEIMKPVTFINLVTTPPVSSMNHELFLASHERSCRTDENRILVIYSPN